MKPFHVIAGIPRSGSTLLCNILSQNPKLHVSSTSHVPTALAALTHVHSTSPELLSLDIRDKSRTADRIRASLRGYVSGWYEDCPGEVIVDKSRIWNNHFALLRWAFPEAKIILTVRDLRSVVDSIERQYRVTAYLDDTKTIQAKTLGARVTQTLSPEGVVGRCILGVEDMLLRDAEMLVIRHEEFVQQPEVALAGIYKELDLEPFEHDLENIENRAEDVDSLYLHKFPHEGDGEFRRERAGTTPGWKLPAGILVEITKSFPVYNSAFHYQGDR